MTESTPRTNHVVSFIDIGTNSIRMLIVRLNPNFSYTVISQEKEVVRLGEREFADSQLQPEAMDRAVLVSRSSRNFLGRAGGPSHRRRYFGCKGS